MDKSNLPMDNIGKLTAHKDQIDYTKLNQQLIQLREDREQIKYELKRKIETFEANEKALTDELEYWKANYDKIKKQLQVQSNQFDEEKIRMQNIHAEETSSLSEEVHKWELENLKLMKKLKDIQNETIAESNDLERIHDLEVEVLNLKEKLNDHHIDLNLLEKKSTELEDRNMDLIQENEEYKQSLCSKREEIRKSNELIMELQDDIAVLRKELDELQSQPRDINTKGNSLFAEVYDSRNQIKEQLLDLAERYQRVIKEKDNLSNEVDILRKETATLREIFNNDMKNFRPGNMFELSGDSASMSAMKTLVKSYKEELDRIRQEEPPAEREFQYYEAIIERQKRELEKMRGILGDHTMEHSLRARKISELGVTLACWKSRASEAESEKRFLKLKVQELENKLIDSEKHMKKNEKDISNKTKFQKIKAKTPEKRLKSENPKEKNAFEICSTHKITIISEEERKALMENKPYSPKKSEITFRSEVENKENEDIQKEVEINLKQENTTEREEINVKQENTTEESASNEEHASESSNKSEGRKKTIQFSENTKKEDGDGYRPKGRNRYVFKFQVKKLD